MRLIGTAAAALEPPFSTNTANATSPCQPTNHECVCAGLLSYSAVPVLPYTGPPGASRSAVAVPRVTTSRIMSFSACTEVAFSSGPRTARPAGAGSSSTFGGTAHGSGLLLIYWALMTLVPFPGCEVWTFDDKACNLAAWLDRAILTENHIWRAGKVFDPEGILSTIPAIVTTLSGVLTGTWLRRKDVGESAAGDGQARGCDRRHDPPEKQRRQNLPRLCCRAAEHSLNVQRHKSDRAE